jgi:hypothetical protein
VLAGFDFYFSKHIYMGAEFYYGFALQIKHEITQIEPTESVLVKRSKTFNVLGNAIPAIRLGWAF